MTDSLERLDSGRYLLKAEISCNDDKDLIAFEIRFPRPRLRENNRYNSESKTRIMMNFSSINIYSFNCEKKGRSL